MKDYYALLSVAPDATADDIKRAFRREIARYHPDKVHHLGREFQALAAERAAELTEAYRVLMDDALRAAYDHELGAEGGGTRAATEAPPAPPPPSARGAPAPEASAPRAEPKAKTPRPGPGYEPPPPSPKKEPAPRAAAPEARNTFVRRMAMTRFRDAIDRSLEGVTSMPARGFEASYLVKGKRSLFGKAVPERILSAYVGEVTADEIAALGQQAIAARGSATAVTVFALGDSLASAAELSSAVGTLRKKAPAGVTLIVVPLDVRDWTPLMPKDASANARAVVAQLTSKE